MILREKERGFFLLYLFFVVCPSENLLCQRKRSMHVENGSSGEIRKNIELLLRCRALLVQIKLTLYDTEGIKLQPRSS